MLQLDANIFYHVIFFFFSVLELCSKLKLLDVSYSDSSVKEAVHELQERFPKVEIKCSIAPEVNY